MHSELMSYLLLAEKQQLLLLKNVESKPVETHTVDVATRKPKGARKQSSKAAQSGTSHSSKDKLEKPYSKSDKSDKDDKSKESRETRTCFKCSKSRHIAKDCKTSQYFVNIYQELKKLKASQK